MDCRDQRSRTRRIAFYSLNAELGDPRVPRCYVQGRQASFVCDTPRFKALSEPSRAILYETLSNPKATKSTIEKGFFDYCTST
jgi:hypothetical protein